MLFEHDQGFGARYVLGVDEVGRGALAGPISAAAVLWDLRHIPKLDIDDSKKLTPAKRAMLAPKIREACFAYHVVHLPANELDRVGLSEANNAVLSLAVRTVLEMADLKKVVVLVDGLRPLPDFPDSKPIVKGDAQSAAIAAASILAKTERDAIMEKLAKEYPVYGWDKNKGYPSGHHRQAIEKHGVSPYHRRSFRLLAG